MQELHVWYKPTVWFFLRIFFGAIKGFRTLIVTLKEIDGAYSCHQLFLEPLYDYRVELAQQDKQSVQEAFNETDLSLKDMSSQLELAQQGSAGYMSEIEALQQDLAELKGKHEDVLTELNEKKQGFAFKLNELHQKHEISTGEITAKHSQVSHRLPLKPVSQH